MGSDESHFDVSLIVRDKVTRQCPQTTIFEEKGEPTFVSAWWYHSRSCYANICVWLSRSSCCANICVGWSRSSYCANMCVCVSDGPVPLTVLTFVYGGLVQLAAVLTFARDGLSPLQVRVMMSMPAKEARAVIQNKQGEAIFFYKLRNLSELFPKATHLLGEDGEPRSDAVEFLIEGRVDGMQLSSHRINLTDHGVVQRHTQTEQDSGKANQARD